MAELDLLTARLYEQVKEKMAQGKVSSALGKPIYQCRISSF